MCLSQSKGGVLMRIERLSHHQFKIFLTFDDLIERGFDKKDLWIDHENLRDLFSEMMYEASDEIGFELYGSLLIQVHLMQAQGMHVTVTQKDGDFEIDEEFIEMKVTLDESKELIFAFDDFEDLISVAPYLSSLTVKDSEVFYFEHQYYMVIESENVTQAKKEDIIAIMAEFSKPSIITSHRLREYGNPIFQSHAIREILHYFT